MIRLIGPLLAIAFWLWMLIDCARNARARQFWMWLLLIFPFPCTLIYFIVYKLPAMRLNSPGFFSGWTRRHEIIQARREVHDIGNAHQFCVLGDLLWETGSRAEALEAFTTALEKEPDGVAALWGRASILLEQVEYERARPCFQKLLELDPGFKSGRAAFAYSEVLFRCGEADAAVQRLRTDPPLRHEPEANIVLARVLAHQGHLEEARKTLQAVLYDLEGAPGLDVRIWRNEAKKLLKSLK